MSVSVSVIAARLLPANHDWNWTSPSKQSYDTSTYVTGHHDTVYSKSKPEAQHEGLICIQFTPSTLFTTFQSVKTTLQNVTCSRKR